MQLEYFPPVETHLISSKHVRQTFRIQVMLPQQRRGETSRFPVVYATDANLTFDMFKGVSVLLQASEYDAPRFILVGIGYPGDSPRAGAVLRVRDLLFPGYPRIGLAALAAEGVLMPEERSANFARAEDFQQFIAQELIPHIDANHSTIPNDRTYFGHSAGGGFGLFTLFGKSQLFRNYIISSPGLIFNGEVGGVTYEQYDFGLQLAQRFIASEKALPGVHLYMSVGAQEEFEPALAPWQLTSSFYRMAALLRRAEIRGLELTTEVFPGDTHMTVWPKAFIHGLQAVFRTGAWKHRSR